MLPPITRVTSDPDLSFDNVRDNIRPASQGSRAPPSRPPHDGGISGFLGGVALQNYRRGVQGDPRLGPAENTQNRSALPDNLLSRSKPPPPPINTGFSLRPSAANAKQPKTPSSFVAPTDLAREQQHQGLLSGKRPSGTRLATEPANLSTTPIAPETHKGKRGLPFLKNPMSTILMRRKTGQATQDTQPLPVSAEPSYDPRIRGTRFHDFSAPRPKRILTSPEAGGNPFTRQEPDGGNLGRINGLEQPVAAARQDKSKSGKLPPLPPISDSPEQELPPVPPVPPKDGSITSHRTSSSLTSRANSTGASGLLASGSSVRTTASRNFSVSSSTRRDSTLSALPKHMKSTSSRFSFDMIGAANQEKLLEEKHRQREQERKTPDGDANVHRDSRFDDFDGDDFDYDAMMDDDGLEERIPGVNADYDEDGDDGDDGFGGLADPDNDQENFSGFVFQRSNPTSSLASPHTPSMMATPRDAEGRAIGFAMTKDITPNLPYTASPIDLQTPTLPSKLADVTPGLGIHDLGLSTGTENLRPPRPATTAPPARQRDDDLYFDAGLADELDFEHDGTTFDESIFDNDDTDRFGRPIPGAFALAKETMRAAQQVPKLDTETTSHPGNSEPTAQISASASVYRPSANAEKRPENVQPTAPPGPDIAYQAALAEAAQKAAALGKFRRSSSPPLPAELTITSPTDSHTSHIPADLGDALENYEDDPFSTGLDDYELDDDMIVAEANASALANDSDGWYGQEFGFYSAPLPSSHGHHSASSSNGSNVLNAENLFQYANGGYFGPAGQGLARTTSGRVISREPNLTPITERSEYSNRNSVMSLALPPALGGEGRSPSAAGMHSPGLAQLALLGSDDENMSLSALRKLRSKAWGGSQASLSSREGSPRSERAVGPNGDPASSPWNPLGPSFLGPGHGHGHARKGSAFSVWSNSDAGESGAGSPTLLVNPLTLPMSPPVSALAPSVLPPMQPTAIQSGGVAEPTTTQSGLSCSPVLESEEDYEWQQQLPGIDDSLSGRGPAEFEPVLSTNPELSTPPPHRRSAIGHRHKGSADSISYTKEEEPQSGGTRWVLERRRTGESGEIEILGREVVEGGSI
jgi:hypothetical protein